MRDAIKCIHCGSICGETHVVSNGLDFCCNGCKTVYELLQNNRLYNYYELENEPGVRIKEPTPDGKFAFLDHPEIADKLYRFKEGTSRKVELYVPAIHCSSCIWLLENLQQLHVGIHHSQVNFVQKRVIIFFDSEKITIRQVAELMASIHYVPEISLADSETAKNKKYSKRLLYQVGVAGFVFGNSMLISLPEYLPGGEHLEQFLKEFFGMMNLLLAIPVVAYSGRDYLISAYKNIVKGVVNIDLPIAIGILALFAQSSFEIISKTGAGYMDSLSGLIFFLLIGKWYQNRSYQALSFNRDYKSYFPIGVTQIKENNQEEITPISDLKQGDRIRIRNGELIPTDAVLMDGDAQIDYSFVTGESNLIPKQAGELLYAGGKQQGTAIELMVEKPVIQSQLTSLWNKSNNDDGKSIQTVIDKISRYFTLVIVSVAIISFVFWWMVDPSKALFSFTSVLIVACPCALALSLPFALGNGMRHLGEQGLFMKNTADIEHLAAVDTLVFDKTGTLTVPNEQQIIFDGVDLTSEEKSWIKAVVQQSTHRLDITLNRFLKTEEELQPERFETIAGKGIVAQVKGNVIRLGSSQFIGVTLSEKISHSTVVVEINNQLKGVFHISSRKRAGVEELLQKLKKRFDIHLISGDNNWEREEWKRLLEKEEQLHFNQQPQEKRNYIENLQQNNRNVAMVGDGLNDAGALLKSDVGISVADNIYHFSPACNAILQADKMSALDGFLKYSKLVIKTVKRSYVISFLYNLIGLFFAVQGALSPVIAAILMPISSVSVVVFVSGATTYQAKRIFN